MTDLIIKKVNKPIIKEKKEEAAQKPQLATIEQLLELQNILMKIIVPVRASSP